MFKKSNKFLRALLPWYINATLPKSEKQAVESMLSHDSETRAELEDWRLLQEAVVYQPQIDPPPQVEKRLMRWIRTTKQAAPLRIHPMALSLTLVVLLVMWFVVRPGVVLQWTVDGNKVNSFKVYRAIQGEDDFELLDEIPVQSGLQQYTYIDALLLPWQTYTYFVEGTHQGGESALSRTVTSAAIHALPGQLALMVASVAISYGVVLLLKRWTADEPILLRGAF